MNRELINIADESDCTREKRKMIGIQAVTLLYLILRVPAKVFTSEQCSIEDAKVQETFENLLVNYNRKIRPNYTGEPLEIAVDFSILRFGSINEVEMTFVIDLFFRQTWIDYRLKHNLTDHIIPLLGRRSPPSLIWTPDTVFINAKRVQSHSVTVINEKLDIYNNGRVFWASRVTVEANCLLDLHRYPVDSQTCKLVLESYGYTTRHLTYKWRKNAVNIIDPNMSQFVLLSKKNKTYSQEYEAGTYTLLEASFTFERRIAVSILQIFFPCIAITCVSWVSLWLHKNCVSARVGIGITTLLTISTIWGSLNRRLPQVSYVKAVDIFFMTSFCFIFLTLLEYTIVLNGKFRMYKNNSYKELRRKKQLRKRFGENATTPRGLLESSYIDSLKSKDTKNLKFDDKLEEKVTICELKESGKFIQYSFVQEGLDDGKEDYPKINRDLFPYFYKVYPVTGKPSTLDVVSRFLFPFSYFCFNLYFWTTYHGRHSEDGLDG